MQGPVMRSLSLLCAFLAWLIPARVSADSQEAPVGGLRGFTVTVDGVSVMMNPGENGKITLKDGRTLTVGLTVNPVMSWSDSMVTFDHPSGINVATQMLSKRITQRIMASAVGTVVIIQEYDAIEPTTLNQTMMNELTKNDLKLGAELTQSEAKKTLRGGMILNGLRGILKSRTAIKTIEVFSYGKDGRGVMLISQLNDDNKANDQAFVDQFWRTLALKF
jgi:hypothetical protein